MLPAVAGLIWLVPCAWSDARTGRLPHLLTLTGLAGALVLRLSLIAFGQGSWLPVVIAVVIGSAALGLHWNDHMGGGDVPMLTGLALLSPPLLAAASIVALIGQAGIRLRRRTADALPLAPGILGGWAIAAGIMCALPVFPGFCAV